MSTTQYSRYPNPSLTTATVTAAVNTNGSLVQTINLTTAVQTFSAPANSVGFVMEAASSNTVNVRWGIGSTAPTTSLGLRLEPGRDTGYIPCAATISVIAESSTNQEVDIQWILSS